jgi:hypothetical protein
MLRLTEGDYGQPLRAVFRFENERLNVSTASLSGSLISPDGDHTDITPVFDAGAAGDGTDGAVSYSGSALNGIAPGIYHYVFYADFASSSRYSTERIPLEILSNA